MTPSELRKIGEHLFGAQWQTPMAEALPCETRTIRHWLSGKRKIRPMVDARIRSLAVAQAANQNSSRAAGTREGVA